MSAYLVLLRMEVAAFHPLRRSFVRTKRLVSVALFLAFVARYAATYSVRALPGILLCGARTFLSPFSLARQGQRRSGWLRIHSIAPATMRQRSVSPAQSGTIDSPSVAYCAGTVHALRSSVTVSRLRGSP